MYRLVSRAKIPPEAVQSIVFQREPNTLRATGGVYVELDSPQHGKALVDVCSDSVICGMKLAPHFVGLFLLLSLCLSVSLVDIRKG